jgi:hypothetical protein
MSDTEQHHDTALDDETTEQAPQTRGLVDGSVNNLSLGNAANVMGVMANSKLADNANNNANTRAAGEPTVD